MAPVVGFVAQIAGWYNALGAFAQAAVQLAAGIALSAAATLFRGKPGGVDVARELARPNSLPPYRFVYGHRRVYGSPAPYRVKGEYLYACYILNSRPSSGSFEVFIDKRRLILTGNIYDFTGTGGLPSNEPFVDHINVWVGRGDQTTPPSLIRSEASDIFQNTDGWRGLTVLWLRMKAGDSGEQQERWPRLPPEVEVEANWSKVWDPRDEAQDPADADTWTFSRNQALCVLDALRINPIRRYPRAQLDIDSFIACADIAEETVARKGGGTDERYHVSGTLIWTDRELEEQVEPLVAAGGGQLSRTGGRLALVPGAFRESSITITDILDDDEVEYEVLRPGSDLATSVKATFISPERDWRPAETPVYEVPGAVEEDGRERLQSIDLEMVSRFRQAQRLVKMAAQRQREQRRLTATFPPALFDAIPGTVVTLDLPAPYTGMNGLYEVEGINPCLDMVGEGGVALRCPAVLVGISATDFEWNAEEDEQEIETAPEFDGTRTGIPAPGTITAVTGAVAAKGDQPRIRFAFDPVDSSRVGRYEWEYRITGESWESGGIIDAAVRGSAGKVFGYVTEISVGESYDIRVRSGGAGQRSAWSTVSGVVAAGPDVDLDEPTGGQATGGSGKITVSFKMRNSPDVRGMQLWVSTTNDEDAATLLVALYGPPNSRLEYEHTGLGSAVTRYYFAKTLGPYGTVSAFSSGVSATTS